MSAKPKAYKSKNRQIEGREVEWYYLIPLALIGALVPTIVYLEVIPLPEHISIFWTGMENWDFFSYHKARWILILTGLSLGSLLLAKLQSSFVFKKDIIYLPMGAYASTIILSTIFAETEYKSIALYGFPDRYEGMYVLLAYIMITFITIQIVNREKHINLIIGSLLISASALSVLGIYQFFGKDYFRTEIGKNSILPSQYYHIKESLEFNFGPSTIYSTFYNTNYVGSYMAMIFLITITLFILSNTRKEHWVLGIVSLLSFSNLLGSNSRAGYVGAIFAIIILVIILYKQIIGRWKSVSTLVLSFVLIFFVMNSASDGVFSKKVLSLSENLSVDTSIDGDYSDNILLELDHRQEEDLYNNANTFKDLSIKDNRAIFEMDREQLIIELNNSRNDFKYNFNDYSFYSGNQELLEVNYDSETSVLKFENEKYSQYSLLIVANLISIKVDDFVLNLGSGPDGNIYFVNQRNELVDLQNIKSWGFEGRELLGSSRGYLWSRSIPMLKDTIILGYGPDLYAMYFPQEDYIGKIKYLFSPYVIVDKPHNIYLQIALNTGVLSLLSFLTIVLMAIISGYYCYNKLNSNYNNIFAKAWIASGLACISYLVAGFFNDNTVSVTPVFWLMLGVHLACIGVIKEKYRF